jgi:hypothetical protein
MIEVYQHAEEATRTPENGCYWLTETMIDGQPYAARSRRGAPHELARALVAAGISDQPMIVRSFGLAGHATYKSLHTMAAYTIEENAGTTPRRVKWREYTGPEGVKEGVGEAQKGCVVPEPASLPVSPSPGPTESPST